MNHAALKEADREITRLIGEGFGLFWIAEAYGVPIKRLGTDAQLAIDINYQELPSYLKGRPGVLTLGYLRHALAEQVLRIWIDEQSANAKPVFRQARGTSAVLGMQDNAPSQGSYMDNNGLREIAL